MESGCRPGEIYHHLFGHGPNIAHPSIYQTSSSCIRDPTLHSRRHARSKGIHPFLHIFHASTATTTNSYDREFTYPKRSKAGPTG